MSILRSNWKREVDEQGHPLCLTCKKPLTGRRWSYCDDACMLANRPAMAVSAVEKRDRGVCTLCGLDTVWLSHWIRSFPRHLQNTIARCYGVPPSRQLGRLWDLDHIIPVSEGGGQCGLENFRTLCIPCHKAETRALQFRLKSKRRRQSILMPAAATETLDGIVPSGLGS